MGREIRLVAVVSPGLVRLEIRGFNSRYARTDRGLIVGRSTGARWRLIEAADRLAIDDSWSFITLTYPRRWPDSTRARADFKRWRLFLDRGLGKAGLGVELAAEGRHKRGGFGGIWNVEVQGRGAWHFNVVGQIRVCPEVRQIVNETWIQASGTAAAGHLKRRTYCEGIVAGRRGTGSRSRGGV